MQGFLRAVFVTFLISFQDQGNATRYLPMIVWDHMNPMLSCKCNWFHDVAKLEIYDRFEFVCPTTKISVRLLDSYSRPPDQMNENIFMRKWEGGMEDLEGLKESMKSGEFCDPENENTTKLHACINGQDGDGKTVRISVSEGFRRDDLVVFFNNGDDGRTNTLTSKIKKCTMAFVALVTWNVAHKYDFTYEKSLNYERSECKNLSTTCYPPSPPTTPCPTTLPSTTSKSSTTYTTPLTTSGSQITSTPTTEDNGTTATTATATTTTTTPTPTPRPTATTTTTTTTTKPNTTFCNGTVSEQRGQPKSEDWDKFTYGFFAGVGALFLINVVCCLAYYLFCCGSKKKKAPCMSCQYKPGNQVSQSTIGNNLQLGSENQAKELPKKSPPRNGHGINNNAFQRETLGRDSYAI